MTEAAIDQMNDTVMEAAAFFSLKDAIDQASLFICVWRHKRNM